MKKRILSLVLTAATILTMTACGSNSEETNKPSSGNTNSLTTNSTESDATQPGDASVPEKEPFKFAGTWRMIQETSEPSKEYLVIDTAGNVTWYDEWSEEPEEYILNDEKPIKIDDDGTYTVYFSSKDSYDREELLFKPIGDSYGMIFEISYEFKNYYYREEDVDNYDIIDLTADNFAQYIETTHKIVPEKDEFGDITYIYDYETVCFKEGLGPASFIIAELKYNELTKRTTYNPVTGELMIGETLHSFESSRQKKVQFCGLGSYKEDKGWGKFFQKNDDGTFLIEDLNFYEFTGAERIIGKVFVPKGWQG